MKDFIDKLFAAAKAAGFDAAEAFLVSDESFKAVSTHQEITQYASNESRGLGFRAMIGGRMGYAATEAFDDAAVDQLVRGAMDSAKLCEDPSEQFIYDGKEPVVDLPLLGSDAPIPEKLAFVLKLEKLVKDSDPRIDQVGMTTVTTGKQTVRIVNTYGMDKTYSEDFCGAWTEVVAKDGDSVASGSDEQFARSFGELNVEKLADNASRETLAALHAAPIPSGSYHVIIDRKAMTALLATFSSVFSAEVAQKDLSRLKGKLGEKIAADCVTIVDDPLLPDGHSSRPFDAEGVPSAKHVVVDGGTFRTFLHNLKTAHKDGVVSTGNAGRGGYAASVRVTPSNLFIEAGQDDLATLMQNVGDGVVITEVSGLHAGAKAVSGDFSLLSAGYAIENGKRGKPIEQITVAGNFFDVLKNVRKVGSDLYFSPSGIGSPSLDVGMLSIAGA